MSIMNGKDREYTTKSSKVTENWQPPFKNLETHFDAENFGAPSEIQAKTDKYREFTPNTEKFLSTAATQSTDFKGTSSYLADIVKFTASDSTFSDYDQTEEQIYDFYDSDDSEPSAGRTKRSTDIKEWGVMLSGACLQGCAFGYWAFTIVSGFINIFGSSGRIGNLLVNYR